MSIFSTVFISKKNKLLYKSLSKNILLFVYKKAFTVDFFKIHWIVLIISIIYLSYRISRWNISRITGNDLETAWLELAWICGTDWRNPNSSMEEFGCLLSKIPSLASEKKSENLTILSGAINKQLLSSDRAEYKYPSKVEPSHCFSLDSALPLWCAYILLYLKKEAVF